MLVGYETKEHIRMSRKIMAKLVSSYDIFGIIFILSSAYFWVEFITASKIAYIRTWLRTN